MRLRPVRVRPYVEMGTQERRRAQEEVSVTILQETVELQERPFPTLEPPRRIGYIFSDNMAGKYTVEMDPESVSQLRTIRLRATEDAWNAYRQRRYPILIEIRDEDVQNVDEPITKDIIYNFPREYVAQKAIELGGPPAPPRTAIIRLIPVTAGTETP